MPRKKSSICRVFTIHNDFRHLDLGGLGTFPPQIRTLLQFPDFDVPKSCPREGDTYENHRLLGPLP